MTSLGHGQGYAYPHDEADGHVVADYLPDALRTARYYEPKAVGAEEAIKTRLAAFAAKKARGT